MNILELTLQTKDLDKTEEFYTKQLGFNLHRRNDSSISFRIGTSILTFKETILQTNPIYHFAFNIPSDCIKEALTWISPKAEIILNETTNPITSFDNGKAKSVYFYDNNKNIVEFIAREDLNINLNDAFSAKQILNINEIGLATEKPLELSEIIIEKTEIQYFSKGPRREDFVALGNEEGLFVISNLQRNWYPTETKATKQRTKVKFEINNNIFELDFD